MITPAFTPPVRYAILVGGLDFEQENGKLGVMEIIDELEPTTRGVYTGCIGFIDPDNSLDFNIAIRTFIKKEDRVYLQVGGGIVYDSNEKDEYQETFDKAKSFLGII